MGILNEGEFAMKKAYVKPVFMAEEFVATASVASCGINPSQIGTLDVYYGQHLCYNQTCGHYVGNDQGNLEYDAKDYWWYATGKPDNTGSNNVAPTAAGSGAYLFTDGTVACDFIWNGFGQDVGIWTDNEKNPISIEADRQIGSSLVQFISSFSEFFSIPAGNNDQHRPTVNNQIIYS